MKTAAAQNTVALTNARRAASQVASEAKAAGSALALEAVKDSFANARVANDFWKVTGRMDQAAFAAKFGDGGMRGAKNGMVSEDDVSKGIVGGGAMVGGFMAAAWAAGAAASATGAAVTVPFAAAAAGGVVIGLGINQLVEAVAGDSFGGALGEYVGDQQFANETAGANGGAGEPNPDAPSSSGVTLFGATGGKLGSKPKTKTTDGAGDPAKGSDSDRAVADDLNDVKNIAAGCERIGGDIAVIDARSLARIALLANAGCRIRA